MSQLQHPEAAATTLTGVRNALSEPARLDIVRSLQNGKEKPCGEFGLHSKSTMPHHFKVLREAGVTRTRMKGRRRFTFLRQDDLGARFPGLLEAVLAARKPF